MIWALSAVAPYRHPKLGLVNGPLLTSCSTWRTLVADRPVVTSQEIAVHGTDRARAGASRTALRSLPADSPRSLRPGPLALTLLRTRSAAPHETKGAPCGAPFEQLLWFSLRSDDVDRDEHDDPHAVFICRSGSHRAIPR